MGVDPGLFTQQWFNTLGEHLLNLNSSYQLFIFSQVAPF